MINVGALHDIRFFEKSVEGTMGGICKTKKLRKTNFTAVIII
jgi:hypothetical protein